MLLFTYLILPPPVSIFSPLRAVPSLFPFPFLHCLYPALQGAQPVFYSARLFRCRVEKGQQDTYQHQAGQSDRRGVRRGRIVGHHQSENPERQDGFHKPEHPSHHGNQQPENNFQHPVADESQQTPLGNGSHTLRSETGQCQCSCGER